MKGCVFCELPKKDGNRILYTGKRCYVVVDRFPSSHGHLLVVPKEHYRDMLSAPADLMPELFIVAQRFAKKAKKKLKADGVNVIVNIGAEAEQRVFHLHVHIIPRYAGKRMKPISKKTEIKVTDMHGLRKAMAEEEKY